MFVVIVHDGVVFLGELKLFETLLDDFLVFFCELFEPLGVIDFENEEALDHLFGPDLVVLFGQKLRNNSLIVGPNGNHIRVLMHIGRLIFFGLAQFFFKIVLNKLKLFFFQVIILLELHFEKTF